MKRSFVLPTPMPLFASNNNGKSFHFSDIQIFRGTVIVSKIICLCCCKTFL